MTARSSPHDLLAPARRIRSDPAARAGFGALDVPRRHRQRLRRCITAFEGLPDGFGRGGGGTGIGTIGRGGDCSDDPGIEAPPDSMRQWPTSLSPGATIAPLATPQPGSLTVVLSRWTGTWLVSAAHVLAPPENDAQPGDRIRCGSVVALLHAWTQLSTDTSTIPLDAAVCRSPPLAPTAEWPDGERFTGFGRSIGAKAPFDLFGSDRKHGVRVALAGEPATVTLERPGGGVSQYARQLPLRAKGGDFVALGDSGGALRDGEGRLVGMLVGISRDRGEPIAWCTPWERIEAWLMGLGI